MKEWGFYTTLWILKVGYLWIYRLWCESRPWRENEVTEHASCSSEYLRPTHDWTVNASNTLVNKRKSQQSAPGRHQTNTQSNTLGDGRGRHNSKQHTVLNEIQRGNVKITHTLLNQLMKSKKEKTTTKKPISFSTKFQVLIIQLPILKLYTHRKQRWLHMLELQKKRSKRTRRR